LFSSIPPSGRFGSLASPLEEAVSACDSDSSSGSAAAFAVGSSGAGSALAGSGSVGAMSNSDPAELMSA
jgi:hypothetical protein